MCSQCAPVLSRYVHTPITKSHYYTQALTNVNSIQTIVILYRYTQIHVERWSTKVASLQGRKLTKKKNINLQHLQPVIVDKTHYRDLVKQNEWLRENLFDAVGNCLYCQACALPLQYLLIGLLANKRLRVNVYNVTL